MSGFASGFAQSGFGNDIGQGIQSMNTAGSNPQNLGGSTPTAAPGQQIQYDADNNIIGSQLSPVPSVAPSPTTPPPALAQAGLAAMGMEKGGVVPAKRRGPVIRNNFASTTAAPDFVRGPASGVVPGAMQSPEDPGTPMLARGGVMPVGHAPHQRGGALPAGPQQGIVPASTEGQVLTMDQGGSVPGFDSTSQPQLQQAQTLQPAVSGKLAGISSGLQSGMVMGQNLRNAWDRHEQRENAADASTGMESTVTGIPEQQSPSVLDQAKGAVEQFFHHLHGGLLDDNSLPNSNQGVTGPYSPTAGANPVPSGPPSPIAAAPAAGIPASAAPAQGAPPAQPAAPAAAGVRPGAPAPAAPAQPTAPPTAQQTGTAIANQSTTENVKQVAADPTVKAGIPQKSPAESGQPHSLSPDWYEHSEQLKMQAMRKAALAGEDPIKVGAAMDALRTGAVQGQVLRNYAAANAAFASGDDKSLKQALQNVNYYLPNGQGLNLKTATASDVAANDALAKDPITGQPKPGYDPNMHVGALMYRSPFAGMTGHENDPPYTTVTQQHISMLAQNALDPANVQKSMLASYTAQRETEAKLRTAAGAQLTGQGRYLWGQAAKQNSDVTAEEAPVKAAVFGSQIQYNQAHANLANAQAGEASAKAASLGDGKQGPKISIANYQKAQQDAGAAVDNSLQGPMTAIPGQVPMTDPRTGAPVMGPDGKPRMQINTSPGAGRSVRDPTKADPIFQGMPPEQQTATRGLAMRLAGSNIGTTNPTEAADAAARIIRFNNGGQRTMTHIDPQTKKPTPDVVPDGDQGTVHVWVGNQWKNFYLSPNLSQSEPSPMMGGASEASAGVSGNPADYTPAVEAKGSDSSSMDND